MAGGSSWNGVKGMKKLFCVLLVGVLMVSLLCVPAFAVNEASYTYWCPNCKRFIGANDVQTNGFLNACPHCNCALSPREGSIFRGGGAGRLGSSSREYYTERSGGGGSFTPGSGAGRYDSGATSYYSLIDETTQSFQFLNQKFTYNTYVYDTDYNYYTVTIDDSENYYIYDYGTYYIINAPTDIKVDNVTQYEDVTIYYELPDGRNSADLKSPEDVYGTVFVYEVGNYEEVLEDDGTTLGLWHLDGNLLNSGARNDNPLTSIVSTYDEGVFGDAIRLNNTKYSETIASNFALHTLTIPYSSTEPFTLEFWCYLPKDASGIITDFYGSGQCVVPLAYGPVGSQTLAEETHFRVETGRWNALALVYDGSSFSWFCNGVKQSGSFKVSGTFGSGEFVFSDALYAPKFSYKPDGTHERHGVEYVLYDEIRLSKGVLYTSNYTPRTEIFDTNLVMVPPQNPKENDLAIKSNVPVSDYRVGGVRPTYPTEGYVYVYLEENVIKDIQQFQNGNWVSVEGSIYKNGEWVDAKNYDLSGITLEPPDDGEGEGGEGGEGEGGEGGEGSDNPEDSSFWDKVFGTLGDALSTIFKAVATLFASLVEGVATLVTSILSVFTDFSGLAAGFSSFLSEVFPFLPPEITSLLVLAISLSIAMAVIRFLKG